MRVKTSLSLILILGAILAGAAVPGALADHDQFVPEGVLWRNDDDGGRTYQLQIDDPLAGPNEHTSIWTQLPPEVQNNLSPLVSDLGTYRHPWTDADVPTSTYGIYTVRPQEGLERFPVVIVENDPSEGISEALNQQLTLHVLSLALNHAPYLANYVLPTSLLVDSLLPGLLYNDPSAYPLLPNEYRNHPTIYVWQTRKVVGDEEVWQGWYLERTGSNGSSGASAFAERRTAFGVAVRINEETAHPAGLFLTERNERHAVATHSEMSQTFTVGPTSEGTDVPLVTVVASDERDDADGQLRYYPDEQRTGYAIGVETPNGFVPLIGTYTEAQSTQASDGTIPHTRTTSVGVFVLGTYEPLVGIQYKGERWPTDLWALYWVAGGGPGSQMSGDWEISAGVFVQGTYEPVWATQYDDAFPKARYDYQMMIRSGVYAAGTFHPLVGVTYDGAAPLLSATGYDQPFLVSAGTFILGDYAPLVGAEFRPEVEGGHRSNQETWSIGVFPADYDVFIPLIVMTWDGEQGSVAWAATSSIHLGEPGHDFDMSLGTADADGQHVPVVGLQYRHEAPSSDAYHGTFTAGVFVLDDFVPVASVVHCSTQSGASGLHPAQSPSLLVGVWVGGSFQGVASVQVQQDANGIPNAQVTPLDTQC